MMTSVCVSCLFFIFYFFTQAAAMELIVLSGGILVVPVLAFITSVLFWPGQLLKAYNW